MWIVAVDIGFYPYINRYESYKEAKEAYDEEVNDQYPDAKVYLAEVKLIDEAQGDE